MASLSQSQGFITIYVCTEKDVKKNLLDKAEVIGFTMEERLDGWTNLRLEVKATDYPYFNDTIIPFTLKNDRVWVLIGLEGPNHQSIFRDWELMQITLSSAETSSVDEPKKVVFELADSLFFSRDKRTAVWKGPVSDIASKIFQDTKIPVLIEKTKGDFTLFQSFQTDWDFLLKRVLIRASNEKGLAGYHVWTRNGKIIFGTASFRGNGHEPQIYDLSFDPNAPSTQYIKYSDTSKLHHSYGGAGYSVMPVNINDRGAGSGVPTSTVESSLSFLVNGITSLFSPKENVTSMRHVSDNSPSELQYIAQTKFEWQKQQFYSIRFQLTQQPFMRIGDYVRLPALPSVGPWQGVYWVTKLQHTMIQGVMSTMVTASRGDIGAGSQSQTPVQSADGTPPPPSPNSGGGIPLNIPSSANPTPFASNGNPPPSSDLPSKSGGPTIPVQPGNGVDALPTDSDAPAAAGSLFATPTR